MPDAPEPDDFPCPPLAITGLVDPPGELPSLDLVPRLRRRRNGWTEEAQRAFIAALANAAACRAQTRGAGRLVTFGKFRCQRRTAGGVLRGQKESPPPVLKRAFPVSLGGRTNPVAIRGALAAIVVLS